MYIISGRGIKSGGAVARATGATHSLAPLGKCITYTKFREINK